MNVDKACQCRAVLAAHVGVAAHALLCFTCAVPTSMAAPSGASCMPLPGMLWPDTGQALGIRKSYAEWVACGMEGFRPHSV